MINFFIGFIWFLLKLLFSSLSTCYFYYYSTKHIPIEILAATITGIFTYLGIVYTINYHIASDARKIKPEIDISNEILSPSEDFPQFKKLNISNIQKIDPEFKQLSISFSQEDRSKNRSSIDFYVKMVVENYSKNALSDLKVVIIKPQIHYKNTNKLKFTIHENNVATIRLIKGNHKKVLLMNFSIHHDNLRLTNIDCFLSITYKDLNGKPYTENKVLTLTFMESEDFPDKYLQFDDLDHFKKSRGVQT